MFNSFDFVEPPFVNLIFIRDLSVILLCDLVLTLWPCTALGRFPYFSSKNIEGAKMFFVFVSEEDNVYLRHPSSSNLLSIRY